MIFKYFIFLFLLVSSSFAITPKIISPVFDEVYPNNEIVGVINYSGFNGTTVLCTEMFNGEEIGKTNVTGNGVTFTDLRALNGFNSYSVSCEDGSGDNVRFVSREEIPLGTIFLLFFVMAVAGALLFAFGRRK